MLVQDNVICWNSVFLMIDRALDKSLTIRLFIIENKTEKDLKKRLSEGDKFTTEDWIVLAEIKAILEPFYEQTVYLQSRAENLSYGVIWKAFSSIEYLLSHILHAIEIYKYDIEPSEPASVDEATAAARKYIKISLDNCHGKLDQYYQLIDETSVYAAATILNLA